MKYFELDGIDASRFKRTVLVSLLFIGFLWVLSSTLWNPVANGSPFTSEPGYRNSAEDGAKIFGQYCARCHGSDGAGDTAMGRALGAPDFTSAEVQHKRSQKQMEGIVTRGKAGMPSFRKKLTSAQITAAVGYIRTLGR
jgi:mono/diheme cytochrome c family protein